MPWSQVSFPLSRCLPVFLSRIGFGVPTLQLFLLFVFQRFLLTHALALCTSQYFETKCSYTSTMHSVRLEPTIFDFIRDGIHQLLYQRRRPVHVM